MQATKTFEQVRGIIQEALSKVKRVVKGAIKIVARKGVSGEIHGEYGERSVYLSALWARDGCLYDMASPVWGDL